MVYSTFIRIILLIIIISHVGVTVMGAEKVIINGKLINNSNTGVKRGKNCH